MLIAKTQELTISLSHYHSEVLHRSIGITEPAAIEGEMDGRFGDDGIPFVHSNVWVW